MIMNRPVKTTSIVFGVPVKLNPDNTYDPLIGTDTLTNFAGVALRNVKQATIYASNAAGQYNQDEAADVLEQGFVTVNVNPGSSFTSGGAVFAIFNSADQFLYFDSVTATGTNVAIALTNCKWACNLQDANNIAELAILTANQG
jgi:hypothetical protein